MRAAVDLHQPGGIDDLGAATKDFLRVASPESAGAAVGQRVGLPDHEAGVDELVRGKVARGSLTVVVERVQTGPALPDAELVRTTASAMLRLADELRLPPPTLAEVLQWLGSAGRSDASTSRPLPPQFRALLERAVDDLLRHRGDDGRGTTAAIRAELDKALHA